MDYNEMKVWKFSDSTIYYVEDQIVTIDKQDKWICSCGIDNCLHIPAVAFACLCETVENRGPELNPIKHTGELKREYNHYSNCTLGFSSQNGLSNADWEKAKEVQYEYNNMRADAESTRREKI
jgi:hypothetical protein